jgi:predicted site-specific integrase-resolvase
MLTKYLTPIVITDVGRGLDLEREGFEKILEQLLSGDIAAVVVANRDRWC